MPQVRFHPHGRPPAGMDNSSSGWLEYFGEGSNADFFAPPIRKQAGLVVPSLSIYEVFKEVLQQRGEDDALQAAAMMLEGTVVDLDTATALSAARVSLEFGLPLADSVMLATARAHTATLWTQDAHFRDLEGVRYIEKK